MHKTLAVLMVVLGLAAGAAVVLLIGDKGGGVTEVQGEGWKGKETCWQ